ncbi:hypothetical protein [Robbsia andropogonis]|nr:hypothetical protein [Robbsia andropogonis]
MPSTAATTAQDNPTIAFERANNAQLRPETYTGDFNAEAQG